ncbi:MAG TPA: PAS domain-containing protein, partial [Deltaproteobacteria bacterium]|nr:PAS domain-containing protein [Deltaproteobacteria bacterium]
MGGMKQDLVYEMLNSLSAGVMLADDSGGIFFANIAAIEYLGIDGDGVREINIDHILHNDSRKKEIMMRSKGDERITVRLSKKVLSNGWTVVVMNDITEIHQLQQELLKMDKLASVGELTSGIAHEIRNPLAGIKTTAQALREEIPPHDNRREYVSRIIVEIDRLNKLLLNFFDFAKPKALSIRSFDVKRVIENTIYMIKDIARANRVQIMEFYPTSTIKI